MAGSCSGVVMAFVNCPVELLKVRLQIQSSSQMKLVLIPGPWDPSYDNRECSTIISLIAPLKLDAQKA